MRYELCKRVLGLQRSGFHTIQNCLTMFYPSTRNSAKRRLTVFDPLSGCNSRVDTGAEVTVLPVSSSNKLFPQQLTLAVANFTLIATYGYRQVDVSLGLRRAFPCHFILVDICVPLLDADFLCHYGLLVDMQHKSL